ncbi:MAG: STAS domain-containing protein [Thermodesulfobacteriota bacterium]
MKIKTERIQSFYIITCEGAGLNPSSVIVFLTAMKAMIQKSNLDILFDLADVQFVAGAQLGTIYRSLEAIEGHGRLVICGLNERDLKLFKITHPHLQDTFIQAASRNEALSALYWETKNAPNLKISVLPEPLPLKEETTSPAEADKKDLREVTTQEREEKEREGAFETGSPDIEFVVTTPPETEAVKDRQVDERKEAQLEDRGEKPLTGEEKRRFGRVKSRQIMDGEFCIFGKSVVAGKHYVAVVNDIGIGGLCLTLSPPRIGEDEELLLDGRIGKIFKFQERAVFHSRRGEEFIFEFANLSAETTLFLNQLFASVNR